MRATLGDDAVVVVVDVAAVDGNAVVVVNLAALVSVAIPLAINSIFIVVLVIGFLCVILVGCDLCFIVWVMSG